MPLTTRFDRSHTRQFSVDAESFLRAIDEGIVILIQEPDDDAAMASLNRAIDAVRASGVMLGSNGLVTIVDVLAESIRLVTTEPRIPGVLASRSVQDIASSLRAFADALADGSDTRPLLARTLGSFQALQELRAAGDDHTTNTTIETDSLPTNPPEMMRSIEQMHERPGVHDDVRDTFVAECAAQMPMLRAFADELGSNSEAREPLLGAMRCLHSIKGAAFVAGFGDVHESCHRSEERILALDAGEPPRRDLLAAEVRLAVASIEELIQRDLHADEQVNSGLRGDTCASADSTTSIDVDVLRDAITRLRSVCERLDSRTTRFAGSGIQPSRDRNVEESLRRGIDEARQELDRMRAVVEGLSDPLAGRLSSLASLGDYVPRLQDAFEAMAREAGKDADLEVQGANTVAPRELLDALLDPLMHVLRNSLSHGIEEPNTRTLVGKPDRGAVLLKVSRSGSSIVVEVFDDGAGIDRSLVRVRATDLGLSPEEIDDADVLDLVFAAGFTTRDEADALAGRGLGLDIVRSTVEGLGGAASIASTLGAGTCVRLLVPIRRDAGIQRQPQPGGNDQSDDTPIERFVSSVALVVDDSVGVRRMLGRTLERHGWQTVQARDGAEALQLIGGNAPDVLITDIEMPRVDGFELVRAIRSSDGWRDIAIVVMTSRASVGYQATLLEMGADACLVKPFDEASLMQILDDVVASRHTGIGAA